MQVKRGGYGQIVDAEIVRDGSIILSSAIKAGKLPDEYIETDRKGHGSCRNYDIYDVLGGTWLVQRRDTTLDKYGAHPIKSYYLIKRQGKGISIREVENKGVACRAAKVAVELGDAIRVLRGTVRLPAAKPNMDGVYYKQVGVTDDGRMVSVYDGETEYRLGETVEDIAKSHHGGGLYVYRTLADLEDIAYPDGSKMLRAPKVTIKVKCDGACRRYGRKYAFSRITPIEILK